MDNVSVEGAKSIEQFVDGILKASSTEIMLGSQATSKKVANYAARQLRAKSPKLKGKYAKGWTVKKEDDGYVVYNKTAPGLAHLLEDGHDVIAWGKKVGRSKAYPHIKPVADEGRTMFIEETEKEVQRRLNNI